MHCTQIGECGQNGLALRFVGWKEPLSEDSQYIEMWKF